jgi:hypothetical protein
VKRFATCALALNALLVMGVLVTLVLVWRSPQLELLDTVKLGPRTNPISLVASLTLYWLLVTTIMLLAYLEKITSKNFLTIACGAAVAMLYLSFLREHVSFGDYQLYIRAAENIIANEPFHKHYVYPPLWASFLAQITKLLGHQGAHVTCFIVNQLSLWGFFILGTLLLNRCGLSLHLSSIFLTMAMIINVPILRNTVYIQVNLLLMDFILAGILLTKRNKIMSALSFALGTHLKVVPILLLPVFLYTKKFSWLFYYSLIALAIMLLTTLVDGGSYYSDFVHNLKSWHPIALRSSSVHSLLVNTNLYLGIDLPVQAISTVVKLVLGLWLYFLSFRSIRKRIFVRSEKTDSDNIINGIIPLIFLMPVISPTTWAHHLVVLIIPTILLFVRLKSPFYLFLFALGYFCTFLLPVFDWYPWSYLRLGGWMILLGLLSYVILNSVVPGWVRVLDDKLNSFFHEMVKEWNIGEKLAVTNKRVDSRLIKQTDVALK